MLDLVLESCWMTLKGHLFFFNFSFNFEALGLDVEGCCGCIRADMTNRCKFFFGEKCCIKISMPNTLPIA